MRIFLDAGHGGYDPGAIGPTGLREADANLQVCQRLERLLLAAYHDVRLSRDKDIFVPLDERARQANRWGADLFLSVHFNAAANHKASGFEAFTSPGQTRSDAWASAILMAFVDEYILGTTSRTDYSDGDADKEANLCVLRETRMPAVLVEPGFVSHAPTEAKLRNPATIDEIAHALLLGISSHLAGSA